jgi:murein DD-endopeptidase MepM/ murein hydrolase activator NlpD
MSVPPSIALPTPTGLTFQKDAAREREQVKTLAQEFEAMLMLQMIRGMRQSMLEDEAQPEGLGNDTLRDNFDVELSRHLSKAGGFGLGDWLARQVSSETEPAARASSAPGEPQSQPRVMQVSDVRHIPAPAGRQADTDDDDFRLQLPIDGKTTSGFGLRADPMSGRVKRHRGVDLRAAYGTEVPAAETGKVVFAGERGAYGNLVVVEHGNGVQTRYAHLSSIAVTPGTPVAAGQAIGRVGSTGRSTAPHLHFEVLVNGERVDPERIAARAGRGPLKFPSEADD